MSQIKQDIIDAVAEYAAEQLTLQKKPSLAGYSLWAKQCAAGSRPSSVTLRKRVWAGKIPNWNSLLVMSRNVSAELVELEDTFPMC